MKLPLTMVIIMPQQICFLPLFLLLFCSIFLTPQASLLLSSFFVILFIFFFFNIVLFASWSFYDISFAVLLFLRKKSQEHYSNPYILGL